MNTFPWADLPDHQPFPLRFALSADGDTATFLLRLAAGANTQLFSYDFAADSFTQLAPAFPAAPVFLGPIFSFVSDDASRIGIVTDEALVAADVDGADDLYVVRDGGGYTLVQPDGVPRNVDMTLAAFSGDGESAVLTDRRGDVLALVSTTGGAQVDLDAELRAAGFDPSAGNSRPTAAISDDGGRVALGLFQQQVIYDRASDTVLDLNDIAPGFELGEGTQKVLSGDGRYLFFYTNNSFSDRPAGLVRIGIDDGSVDYVYEGNDGQEPFSVSDDGRYVAFATTEPDLVPDDPGDDAFPREPDVFVRDMMTGALTRIAPDPADGELASRFNTAYPVISGDGTKLMVNAILTDVLDFNSPDYGGTYWVDGYGTWLPAIEGDDGANRLVGTEADDVLRGFGGNDTLVGNGGEDTLEGGDGTDILIGGGGNDVLRGGATEADRRDVIYGGAGNDFVDGGYGNDELRGDAGNDTLEGGFGADTVIGGDGNDVLTGSAFSDLLFGGDGMDFVNGGFGSDRVNGGAGADRFLHVGVAGHGSDWIQDFSDAEGDTLVWGGGAASRSQFQVNVATTPGAGDAGIEEAFVIYRPTGQILWALVDGVGEDSLMLQIGGASYDLLA
ncbi:hypothetical protein RISW2_20835 [Roseivivax isoporae LMG 25204]|uniref:Calcium-binding protein n=1 Tax=Roseivivax isoporae LMG 25204 TaxID=1449351 RepID=X7F3J0_9RHOB|nr:hypothetical protein RISW2_20835 [Roseivivax isoporae LMG 25204]